MGSINRKKAMTPKVKAPRSESVHQATGEELRAITNRIEETINLFQKIGEIKRTFHARLGI